MVHVRMNVPMIQNDDIFQDKTPNLTIFTHFEKSILINNDKHKHVIYWGNCMYFFNNKLQKNSFKNSFI